MDGVSRGWCILLVAGLTEVVWATAMGLSDGFREWEWTLVTAVFLTISTWLLSKALDHGLPVGGAYATWVGIGALGTMAVSSLIGMEHLSAESVLFVLMVAAGVIGLQATGRGHARRGRCCADVPAVPATSFRRGRISITDACARRAGFGMSRTDAEGRLKSLSVHNPVETIFCGRRPTIVILFSFVCVRNRSYSFANE